MGEPQGEVLQNISSEHIGGGRSRPIAFKPPSNPGRGVARAGRILEYSSYGLLLRSFVLDQQRVGR